MRKLTHDDQLRDYLQERILKSRERDLSQCEVVIPLSGVQSAVRLVRFKDGGGVVVRMFTSKGRKKVKRLLQIDELLEQHHITAPHIIDHYELARPPIIFLTQQMVCGSSLSQLDFQPQLIPALAEVLSSLHRVKYNCWGPVGNEHRGEFFTSLMRRVNHRLHTLKYSGRTSLLSTHPRILKKWFSSWRQEFQSLRMFDLVHDKPNPGNFIYDEQKGKIFLLDFDTVQFGHKGKDLMQIYHELLHFDTDLISHFEQLYFARFTPAEQEEFRRLFEFFHAYYHLSKAANYRRRRAKALGSGLKLWADWEKKFNHHWQVLMQIIA